MPEQPFDRDAWLARIAYDGPLTPDLSTLRAVIAAHSRSVPFENIDVLLGRTPNLAVDRLRSKVVASGRGGYCFELNTLLRAGLTALGFRVTALMARVIRGMEVDAPRPETHMALKVDLAEGPHLADVGFGNLTPTAPLALLPMVEQQTPHELVRLVPVDGDLVLQAKIGDAWQNIYRLSDRPHLAADYEVANWFTATHPASPFVDNLIVARPGADGARNTFFNGHLTIRRPGSQAERRTLEDIAEIRDALAEVFGLNLPESDLAEAIAALDRKRRRGTTHPFFT